MSQHFFSAIDLGSIPAAIAIIEEDLKINGEGIAILSVTTCFICGSLTIFMPLAMRKLEVRTVLIACQIFNAIGALLFVYTSNYWLLLMGRGLCGTSQAFAFSYSPVWINEFAPRARQTIWMANIAIVVFLGSLAGFIIGSIAADNKILGLEHHFGWRHCFFI